MSTIFGPVRQIGYVVYNLDEAISRWTKIGIGPFYRIDHAQLDYFRVAGIEHAIDLSLALGFSGGMQFELIEQHNPEPSPYKDFLDEKGEGMHHVCVWSYDYENDMAGYRAQGHKVAFDGMIGGGRFSYLDAPFSPGTYVEVGDLSLWKGVMAKMEEEANSWDGREPVRSMAELVAATG